MDEQQIMIAADRIGYAGAFGTFWGAVTSQELLIIASLIAAIGGFAVSWAYRAMAYRRDSRVARARMRAIEKRDGIYDKISARLDAIERVQSRRDPPPPGGSSAAVYRDELHECVDMLRFADSQPMELDE